MILNTRVTYFRETTDTEVGGSWKIGDVLKSIKAGVYKEEIKKLRAGNQLIKKELPTVAMHGTFEFERTKKSFIEASGIIILDIDDVAPDEIEDIKKEIWEDNEHILAVMTSPSGNGIKILYYVTPELVTAETYRLIGKELVKFFDIYGNVDYLSITDCLIMTWDENILINDDPSPAFVYIPDIVTKVTELEPVDKTKSLWDDAEEFYETVLYNDIAQKTNNNYHFIQVSILDLAKYGFTHPSEDLSFVIDLAEGEFKSSADNRQRFLEVTELAKTYPQTQWPYKHSSARDEEEEDDVDYSVYASDFEDAKDSEEEDDQDVSMMIINPDTFMKRVRITIAEGDRVGFELSFENFKECFRPKGTGILTVTGIPGSGKTEWVDAMTVDLARLYGHHTLVAGFEQSPEEHCIKKMRKMVGANITCPSWMNEENEQDFQDQFQFIMEHFSYIDINRTGGNILEILRTAAERIKQLRDSGVDVKYLVIDPFNMLSIKGRLNGTERIEEILRKITQFSHQMDILTILIAHPFKMKIDEKTGEYVVPDFYSVKGSSAFFEMSYHGMVVYRKADGTVMVRMLKVKQNNMGRTGAEAFFDYQVDSGRYIPLNEEGIELSGDHRQKNW